MRQRLGIAHALLGDPEVLILDEPANGLDPAGIRWMRDLLRGYANEGGTVLLSSHLLNEIERVADEIIVIGHGRIVAQGTKDELLAGAGTYTRSTDDDALLGALAAQSIVAQRTPTGGLQVEAEPIEVGRVAAAHQIVLTELRGGDSRGLEEMFLDLTADAAREEVAA
jgi:ABC-2 type transport system ATP-binding protein